MGVSDVPVFVIAFLGAAGAAWAWHVVTMRLRDRPPSGLDVRTGQVDRDARATRGDAYATVLITTGEVNRWADKKNAPINIVGGKEPDRPEDSALARAEVLVQLHGSKAVRDAWKKYAEAFDAFTRDSNTIDFVEAERRKGGDRSKEMGEMAHKARVDIRGHRVALANLRDKLADAMRTDLHDDVP
jgi:hypothetical protein